METQCRCLQPVSSGYRSIFVVQPGQRIFSSPRVPAGVDKIGDEYTREPDWQTTSSYTAAREVESDSDSPNRNAQITNLSKRASKAPVDLTVLVHESAHGEVILTTPLDACAKWFTLV